jgi:hypothetical protein
MSDRLEICPLVVEIRIENNGQINYLSDKTNSGICVTASCRTNWKSVHFMPNSNSA